MSGPNDAGDRGHVDYYDGPYYEDVGFTPLHRNKKRYLAKAELAAYTRRDIPQDARLFEFGYALGYNLLSLPNKVKAGFDLSSEALACCREHGLTVYDNLESIPPRQVQRRYL